MREDFDEITWVAAAVKGNHLYISIKENDSFEGGIKSTEIPENIIASDDGTIESIITRSGTPLVKKGDNVEKGQVLVSGVVRSEERRVGKECRIGCRSRWSPYH